MLLIRWDRHSYLWLATWLANEIGNDQPCIHICHFAIKTCLLHYNFVRLMSKLPFWLFWLDIWQLSPVSRVLSFKCKIQNKNWCLSLTRPEIKCLQLWVLQTFHLNYPFIRQDILCEAFKCTPENRFVSKSCFKMSKFCINAFDQCSSRRQWWKIVLQKCHNIYLKLSCQLSHKLLMRKGNWKCSIQEI